MSNSFNNSFANRLLVLMFAAVAAVFYLLYRRKARHGRTS
jgi:hypothetical protein